MHIHSKEFLLSVSGENKNLEVCHILLSPVFSLPLLEALLFTFQASDEVLAYAKCYLLDSGSS